MTAHRIETRCAIAGGGPAGMMLGYLLARAGVEVVVLEKHADFLRDFRGDTIHPSTLEVMHELDLLERFLKLPHQKVDRLTTIFGDRTLQIADLRHLPTVCKFVAFMPQWDFLNFIAEEAGRLSTFRLMMRTEATGLVRDGERVVGLSATGPEGEIEIAAPLAVAADGRGSRLRERSGLDVEDYGAPMDVLWFRLARPADAPKREPLGRFQAGAILIMIDRGDYFQCGYVFGKGGLDALHAAGFEAFKDRLKGLIPRYSAEIDGLAGWDEVHLLTVQVNRLKQWYLPGLLLIGDAAHAMSPVAGVGVNLAVQDAVAAANALAAPLRESGAAPADVLAAIQARRERPTRQTQRLQLLLQNRVIGPTLAETGEVEAPLPMRLLDRVPLLRRLPGRLIGLGVRPEHVSEALRRPAPPRQAA
jgi:2-polyprenyl-6-methoxyphenol hydroxylase-like FAD-dependent oxidoreductase